MHDKTTEHEKSDDNNIGVLREIYTAATKQKSRVDIVKITFWGLKLDSNYKLCHPTNMQNKISSSIQRMDQIQLLRYIT